METFHDNNFASRGRDSKQMCEIKSVIFDALDLKWRGLKIFVFMKLSLTLRFNYLFVYLFQMAGGADPKWQKDAADQNFDYMFKLLIIGNSSVGKTSFLFRYADDSFTSAFVSTVGIDFKVKTVFRNDKRVKLQIWVREKEKISSVEQRT